MKSKELIGQIIDFDYKGMGMTKLDDIPVFLDKGVIGDKVSYTITKDKKSFYKGRVTKILKKSKEKHEKLGDETHAILAECGDETKEPNLLAKGMSWMKTNAKVMMDDSDATIADLIVDGCNMGIKTLCRYENQYAAADEESQKLTDNLIRLEEKLRQDLREYL